MQNQTMIHLDLLTQRLGRHEILHDLSLELGTGIFGLLGPNGAGKTTLIRTLATILPPTSGEVTLLGYDIRDARQRRELRQRLGYLPQQFGYDPEFTVSDFVEYIALLKEVPPAQVPEAVQQAISRVDLSAQATQRLKTLSGGMIRRVGIAQAIVNRPRLLLLDEPTVGLDPQQRIAFRALIRELGHDTTVLLSTHLVEDVAAACSEVVIMNGGRFIHQSSPMMLERVGQREVALGDTPLERGYSHVLMQSHASPVEAGR